MKATKLRNRIYLRNINNVILVCFRRVQSKQAQQYNFEITFEVWTSMTNRLLFIFWIIQNTLNIIS